MNNVKILDCTLRDGGYYNNWEFSISIVNSYLKALSETGVSYVELGFRSLQNKDFKGPNWYTSDSYIEKIKIPKNINIGVMVNASELISSSFSLDKTIRLLFKKRKKTKIKFLCKGITIKNMLKNNEINTLIKLIAGVLKEASVLEEIRISLYVIGVSNPEPK